MFFYTALVTLSLPVIVVEKAGESSKGVHLGLITAAGALLSIGVLSLFGIYRDRKSRTYQGASYPLFGLAVSLPALAAVSFHEYYGVLAAAFLVLIVSRSFCESSHLSVLTDRPELGNKGTYTSWITFWHFLGSGLGALSFGFLPQLETVFGQPLAYGLGAVSILVVTVSMLGFYLVFYRPGQRAGRQPARETETVRFEIPPSLRCLILARFFLLSGVLIIATFLVYVVLDYLGAAEIKKTASLLYFWSILGSILSAVPAGKIIRKRGEIQLAFIAGGILSIVTALFFLLGPRFPVINIPCMILYGAGFAGIIASGLSLTVKLMPHPQMSGRIMAIFASSTFLAQFLASMSGALVLDPLNRWQENLGYFGLFALTEIYFFLGGFFLYRIKSLQASELDGQPASPADSR